MVYDNNTAIRVKDEIIQCFEAVAKDKVRVNLDDVLYQMYKQYGISKTQFDTRIAEIKPFFKKKVTVHGKWMKPTTTPAHLIEIQKYKVRVQDYWRAKKERENPTKGEPQQQNSLEEPHNSTQ